jgi:hypothetical protein
MFDIAKISMGFYFFQICKAPSNKDLRVNSAVNRMAISNFSF